MNTRTGFSSGLSYDSQRLTHGKDIRIFQHGITGIEREFVYACCEERADLVGTVVILQPDLKASKTSIKSSCNAGILQSSAQWSSKGRPETQEQGGAGANCRCLPRQSLDLPAAATRSQGECEEAKQVLRGTGRRPSQEPKAQAERQ